MHPIDLELLDPLIQCLVNLLQRTITEFVYLIEAHHHLNPLSISERDDPWRIDDCVVMLVFEARGIPSRFDEVQLSLVALNPYLEVFYSLSDCQMSGLLVDGCSKNLFVFRREVVQVTLKISATEDNLLHIVVPIHGKDFNFDNTEDPHMCPDCAAITFRGVFINVESLSLEPPANIKIVCSLHLRDGQCKSATLATYGVVHAVSHELVAFFHLILKMNYIRMKDFDDFKCRAFQVLRFKLSNSSSLTEPVHKRGDITDDRIDQVGSGVAGRSSLRGFHQSCLKFTLRIWHPRCLHYPPTVLVHREPYPHPFVDLQGGGGGGGTLEDPKAPGAPEALDGPAGGGGGGG
nr:hypothetical protein [Tanacetum cinerariifolium]